MREIVVYGATGFTGRMICAALQRRGVAFRIAGRDEGKLRLLAGALGKVPAETIDVAPLDDAGALERMASRAKVVLDCAGPFATMGRPVLEACLAAGAHFLDITGESDWMMETLNRDAEARRRKVALVNAVGFDVVPTDCAAALAAEALGSRPAEVRIAICALRAQTTQGTARSALGIFRGGGLVWDEGALRHERLGAHRWSVPFPQPVGAREAMSAPLADVVTAPRTTGAATVRCFLALPPGLMRVAPLGAAAARLPGFRALAEAWIRRLPEGPDAATRRRVKAAAYAEVSGPNGTRGAWTALGDPYDLTAESASLCAVLASSDAFAASGSLSPVQAFGLRPLLDGLAPAGLRHGLAG